MLELNSEWLVYALMATVLSLLIARVLRQYGLSSLERLAPQKLRRLFRQQQDLAVLAFKKCPQCADQLPVSALVCDACDYNFLASSILRHKLLPAPKTSMDVEAAQKSVA